MGRTARKYLDTSFFYIMVQGINKEYIFKNEKYIQKYIQLFMKNVKPDKIKVIAYCIMNNHAHLLINVKEKGKLPIYMQNYLKYLKIVIY